MSARTARPFEESLRELLHDEGRARALLEVALEEYEQDRDQGALLRIFRLVVEAQGGIGMLARRTRLSRQALYKALSPNGNPRLDTLSAIVSALGYRLTIAPLAPPARRRAVPPKQRRSRQPKART